MSKYMSQEYFEKMSEHWVVVSLYDYGCIVLVVLLTET